MEIRELEDITTEIVTTYYRNDLRAFFSYVDEGALWIGPRQGQMISGKKEMQKAWASEKNDLRFKVHDLQIMTEQLSRDVFSQIAFCKVSTIFPNQTVTVHAQRILFLWKERRRNGDPVFRIKTIFISNAVRQSGGDVIYAAHDDGRSGDEIRLILPHGTEDTIAIRTGRSKATYLPVSSIYRVESTDRGAHTIFYTREGQIKCIDPIRELAGKADGRLLKCHASHLVNPMYVRSIQRFSLTMSDGTQIPIPEKKYTAFRSRLDAWRKEAEEKEEAYLAEGQDSN